MGEMRSDAGTFAGFPIIDAVAVYTWISRAFPSNNNVTSARSLFCLALETRIISSNSPDRRATL